MARDRDDDIRDDDAPPPRRRDDDDAPRSRRRRDDDDDLPAKPGGMEGFFSNTPLSIILSVVFFLCCPLIGLILGGIGMGTTKTPDAKRNAMIMLIASVVGIIVGLIVNFAVLPNMQQNR